MSESEDYYVTVNMRLLRIKPEDYDHELSKFRYRKIPYSKEVTTLSSTLAINEMEESKEYEALCAELNIPFIFAEREVEELPYQVWAYAADIVDGVDHAFQVDTFRNAKAIYNLPPDLIYIMYLTDATFATVVERMAKMLPDLSLDMGLRVIEARPRWQELSYE